MDVAVALALRHWLVGLATAGARVALGVPLSMVSLLVSRSSGTGSASQ
jgi:hypothetical protein